MPKPAASQRAWGTRYDTLTSSPPTSPAARTTHMATARPHSPISKPDIAENADGRSEAISTPTVSKPDKPNNDNSIFVGSLPGNVEPPELSRLLAIHLAEYSEAKDVKAIRDHKGGVCAFIQCEDPAAASQLLTKLQGAASSRLFQGRSLRYEFARAARALTISYRTPPYHPYPNSGFEGALESENTNQELPTAIRILKPTNSKFPTILYNAEARNFDAKLPSPALQESTDASNDVLSGAGVLFDSLKFDGETLRKIASCFGPIEHFGPFPSGKDDLTDESVRPQKPMHDVPRSPEMEAGIWEIKWENRGDSVNAYIILRHIPHFVVTWAHHTSTESTPNSRFATPTGSPGPQFHARMRTQSRPYIGGGEYHRFGEAHSPFLSGYMPPSSGNLRLMPTSPLTDASRSPNIKNWTPTCASPNIRGPTSPLASRDSGDLFSPDTTLTPHLTDADFPPLHNVPGRMGRMRKGAARPLSLPWTQRRDDHEGSAASTSPSSSLSVQPSTPSGDRSISSPRVNAGDEYSDKQQLQPPLSPTDNASDISGSEDDKERDQGQELTVPPTPDFTTASITPITPKTGQSYPQTPQSAASAGMGFGDPNRSPTFHVTPKRMGRFGVGIAGREPCDERHAGSVEYSAPREVDPLSIFVGGLEINPANPWTEARLKTMFDQYGVVEDVKLYEHVPKGAIPFAFVKFADAGAPGKAIAGENHRLYDGRPLRVQLREIKPPGQRTPYKTARNRPRPRVFGDSPHRLSGDFHEQTVDDLFAGLSPKSLPGRSVSQEPYRHMTRSPAGSLHFHPRTDPTDASAGHNAFTASLSATEYKSISPPQDNHAAAAGAWRASMYPADPAHASSNATSTSISPAPSSGSTNAHTQPVMGVVPGPYPMMMPPQAWMHPYHAYGYAMPYMPHPAYMGMGYQPQMVPSYPNTGQDATTADSGSAAAATQQAAWQNMYKMMQRHPSYPPQANSADSSHPHTPQNGPQPPVRAIGFEQDAQGILIPMYPPEALNQYMTSQGGVPPTQAPHGPTPPPQAATPSAQQQPHPVAGSQPGWPQYPGMTHGPMPMYSYASYGPHMPVHGTPSTATAAHGAYPQAMVPGNAWASGAASQPAYAHAQPQTAPTPTVVPSSTASSIATSSSFRTSYSNAGDHSYGGGYNNHGRNGAVPPRRGGGHGMSRGYGGNRYNNNNANGHRGFNPRGGAAVEASYSFVDGMTGMQQSHSYTGVRASGSYPGPAGSGAFAVSASLG